MDEVREVVTLGSSEIEKLSQNTAESKKSFITGVGKHNGELISVGSEFHHIGGKCIKETDPWEI